MKTLFIVLSLVIFSVTVQAQTFSNEMKKAFKSDDPEMLLAELKTQNQSIESCFLLEDKPYSLLTISIKSSSNKIFETLIKQKIDLNKICDDKSALMSAAKYGMLDMAKALVKAGANPALQNNEHKTALDYAKKYDKIELVDFLSSLTTK